MVDCAQDRADRPEGDFAIPRLRALPYKINGKIEPACVRAAMARWNQVKGATPEEKASAKRKLISAAKKVGIDVGDFAEEFGDDSDDAFMTEPKWVDDRAKKFLADPDFYPDKSPEDRKSIAYALANKQYNDMIKKKKSSYVPQDESTFHGDHVFQVETFAGGEEFLDESLDVAKRFHGIKPIDPSSLMMLVTVQTEAPKKDRGYRVTKKCTEEGIKRLSSKRYNTVFSTHRYEDEYAVGLTRKIVEGNKAIIEVFRGEEDHQGRIIARSIETGRIKAVSSGFMIREQICGICGEVGTPYLRCDHFPGGTYDGKVNIVDVTKADYYEISTTAIGADEGAWIMHAETISRLYPSSIGDRFIRTNDENINHIQNLGVPTKMEESDKQKEKKKADDSAPVTDYLAEINDLKAKYKAVIEIQAAKEAEIKSLKASNENLNSSLQKVKVEKRKTFIQKVNEARKLAGWVSEDTRETEVAFLETQNDEQLEYLYNNALANAKQKPIEQGVSPVPRHSDLASFKTEDMSILVEKKLAPFYQYLKVKSERQIKGGNKFQKIEEQDRLYPMINGGRA